MKILFLVPRLDKASTRYRVLQFVPWLEAAGCVVEVIPLTGGGHAKSFLRAAVADIVVVQKKLFSSLAIKLLRRVSRRLIYDFDDAVMYKDRPSSTSALARQKKRFIGNLRRADLVIAGNRYLMELAADYHPDVRILPTCLDMDRYIARRYDAINNPEVIIGWIGSRGTLKYLEEIAPALEKIGKLHPYARLKIVADEFFDMESLSVIKKIWSHADEIADLHSFDIGLMPLADDSWTRGKCAFKLLQCMAVGVPVVASPVGANQEVVTDGREGFFAASIEEWADRLSMLIKDASLRQRMGMAAREKVLTEYSLQVNAPKLHTYLCESRV
jgi:glycosyltransferase involved in cell wall biosynthesis